jgi:hypothetical protein
MQIPLIFEIFAFGLRIAFCDLYRRQLMEVYWMDVGCDVLKIADLLVTLVTVVPKGTYPKQSHAATSLSQIAYLYFQHKFIWAFAPPLCYQVSPSSCFSFPSLCARSPSHSRDACHRTAAGKGGDFWLGWVGVGGGGIKVGL